MIRVAKVSFHASKSDIDRLFGCNRISGEIWNECLKVVKNYQKETGQWISKSELQKAVKRKYALHSQSIQAVAHKYLEAREGARQARAKGQTTVAEKSLKISNL